MSVLSTASDAESLFDLALALLQSGARDRIEALIVWVPFFFFLVRRERGEEGGYQQQNKSAGSSLSLSLLFITDLLVSPSPDYCIESALSA